MLSPTRYEILRAWETGTEAPHSRGSIERREETTRLMTAYCGFFTTESECGEVDSEFGTHVVMVDVTHP